MKKLEDLREKVKALMDSSLVFVAVYKDHSKNMREMMTEMEQLRRDRWLDELTDETQIKTMDNTLALLNGTNPRDEMEGMLATQMVGVHNIAMDAMRRAMIYGQHSEARDRYSNQAIKLMRTFTAQMEALDKHRRKGQQKVVVEHVHVHEGGQAIVGSVSQRGGPKNGK